MNENNINNANQNNEIQNNANQNNDIQNATQTTGLQETANIQQTTNTTSEVVANNTVENATQNTNKNKKPPVTIIAIIVGVILVVAGVLCVCFIGKDKPDNPTPPTENQSKLNTSVSILNEKEYLVKITNNKSDILDINASLNIKDENGNIVKSTSKEIYALGIGESSYFLLDYTGFEDKKYEVVIDSEEKSDSSKVFTKQMEFNVEKKENHLEFTMKNNSTSKVEKIDFEIVYYSNDKVIKYNSFGYSNLEAGQMLMDTIYAPVGENGDTISYDNYELIYKAYN